MSGIIPFLIICISGGLFLILNGLSEIPDKFGNDRIMGISLIIVGLILLIVGIILGILR